LAALGLAALPALAGGQADPGAPYVAKAKEIAGKDFAWTANLLCTPGVIVSSFFGGATMQEPDQAVPPTQVFDDLFYVGLRQVGTWIVRTPDGLILIDSLYAGMGQSVIEPGMRALGLNPADVKYVVLTHGHADHVGGARWFQDRYGARVVMSAIDWQTVQALPGDASTKPRRDMVLNDGQQLTLGKTTVTAVLIPGHTPGSLALILPVTDRGAPHMAALWGGTMISAPVPLDLREAYLASIDHFLPFARKAHVDVAIENHPYVDKQIPKLFLLKDRKPGEPNPFVIGEDGFERYLGVLKTCGQAGLERAKVGLERVQ
jgi:metallo-beta-lactamase class B